MIGPAERGASCPRALHQKEETGEALAANASKKRLMCIPAAERSHRHVH